MLVTRNLTSDGESSERGMEEGVEASMDGSLDARRGLNTWVKRAWTSAEAEGMFRERAGVVLDSRFVERRLQESENTLPVGSTKFTDLLHLCTLPTNNGEV